jgi:predicted metal-dependent phosphoesterase TrpH
MWEAANSSRPPEILSVDELLAPIFEYAARREMEERVRWARRPSVRVDLHCHSTYSDEKLRWLPSVVFHPVLRPEQLYELAKFRGMDFVTITDHDTIDGCKALLDRRGNLPDFFVGEEVSARFPEDGTVVHVNVYDHDEAQHREIQRLRENIYDLTSYLRRIDKVFVLNHMTWTQQHRVLSPAQLEAVLRLFDVFEGLNGARSHAHNAFVWHATRNRGKVLVGGSDSHTHRVGTVYTLSEGTTPVELLANIQSGLAAYCGASALPETLREDVWIVLQHNFEQRLAKAHSRWRRLAYRLLRRAGKRLHPLMCLGYHKRQTTLIRGFLEALPAT